MKDRLRARFPDLELVEQSQQLNHYFTGGDGNALFSAVANQLNPEDYQSLRALLDQAETISVRTRQLNEQVLLVVKAAIDDTTSQKGIARREFERPTVGLTLDQLDQLLNAAGFQYQAKWSRQREAYRLAPNLTISIDKNAGYGYLAEFERVVTVSAEAEAAQTELRQLMSDLEVTELAQDRLERMFTFYNEHWPEYYGTGQVFVVE